MRGASLLAGLDFKQYNTIFGDTILGTGDGLIYTLAPAVTPGLTGTASKVYDGTAVAALVSANYMVSGEVDDDTVILNNPVAGAYDGKYVGAGKTVIVTGLGIGSVDNGGKPVYGYQVASTTANANIGEITPKALSSVSLTGSVSKVYDGNATVSNLGTGNYSIAGEGATIKTTTGSYNAGKDVQGPNSAVTSSVLAAGNCVADVGTLLSNYDLSAVTAVSATGAIGQITPKALSVVADGKSKSAGTLNSPFTASIAGFVAGESVTSLGGSLLFTTPATVSSPAGTYLITPYGLTSTNYAITFLNGQLTVTAPATTSISNGVTAITNIQIMDEHLIRTLVNVGGGLIDTLNPAPPPDPARVSSVIRVVDCGVQLPDGTCGSIP